MKLPDGEYWIYLRKSRADMEAELNGQGETLAKHRKALYKLAKEKNLNITQAFAEIASGESLLHRPEMMRMLQEMEKHKPKGVLVMDFDRLGRGDKMDQGLIERAFKEAKTLIITPTDVYDLNDESGEFNVEVKGFLARLELKQITKRMQGGRKRSVEEGNYLGTRPPYGYNVVKDKTGRYLVPHPDQSPVVKMIFELYTHDDPNKRIGTNKIATRLNQMGLKSYTDKPWTSSAVLNIIKNAVYAGRIQWGKKETVKSSSIRREVQERPKEEWIDVKGKHEPLISTETYNKAQEILVGKYHVPYQLVNGITNPLAGLIKCDKCGSSIIYRPYTNQPGHLMCYNKACNNKSSRFEYVEKALMHELTEWITEYEHTFSKPKQKESNLLQVKETAVKSLNIELQELESQKLRLHDFLERGIYNEETYLTRSQNLAERIELTRERIAHAELDLQSEAKKEKAQNEIIPNVKKVLKLYWKAKDPAKKNTLLKSILMYATYRKEKWQKLDQFTLKLYPRIK